jgi:pyrroline-5-carboxylate reductase
MCAICPARNATKADVKLVSSILGAAGQTVVLKEKDFDAVTALSGSGPAFFAFMEEAMAEGGVKLGLKPDVARKLAEKEQLPDVLPDDLQKQYPQFANSLLNLLRTAEKQLEN